MAQEFSHPTRSEMPEIASLNSFGMESLTKSETANAQVIGIRKIPLFRLANPASSKG
jgi:hypothetical protein